MYYNCREILFYYLCSISTREVLLYATFGNNEIAERDKQWNRFSLFYCRCKSQCVMMSHVRVVFCSELAILSYHVYLRVIAPCVKITDYVRTPTRVVMIWLIIMVVYYLLFLVTGCHASPNIWTNSYVCTSFFRLIQWHLDLIYRSVQTIILQLSSNSHSV